MGSESHHRTRAMPKVIVLPTGEDHADFKTGRRPNNHLERSFATDAEAKSYEDGIGAVNDLVEYAILKDKGFGLTVKIAGESIDIVFDSVAEKDAYKQGLEDGDGFNSPRVLLEGSEEFSSAEALLAPSPAP